MGLRMGVHNVWFINTKFKIRQNYSMLLEVKKVFKPRGAGMKN